MPEISDAETQYATEHVPLMQNEAKLWLVVGYLLLCLFVPWPFALTVGAYIAFMACMDRMMGNKR